MAKDEQRHIGFGVKLIADLIREDPECEPAIGELLREILPYTAAVFVPPDWDERYVTLFGFTLEDVYTHGADAIDSRLRAAGLDPSKMRIGLPFDIPPRERADRALTLLRSGYLGEPNGHVTPNPEATAMLFDGLRRQLDTSIAPGATIQWDFTDAEPWHLRIDNGATAAAPGRVEASGPQLQAAASTTGWTSRPGASSRGGRWRPARSARAAGCGCCCAPRSCSRKKTPTRSFGVSHKPRPDCTA